MKNCPFCNGEPDLIYSEPNIFSKLWGLIIRCNYCNLTFKPNVTSAIEDGIIKNTREDVTRYVKTFWNTRQ